MGAPMISKFMRGFTDGSLSTVGIVIGASSASIPIIIAAGVGGTLANGISNTLSAFSAERTDQYQELRDVENAMVDKELKGSMVERWMHKRTVIAGTVDGFATIVGGLLPVLPYLAGMKSHAIFVSIGLVIFSVSLVGIYLGKISRQNILVSATKMALYAAIVAGVIYLIQSVIVSS